MLIRRAWPTAAQAWRVAMSLGYSVSPIAETPEPTAPEETNRQRWPSLMSSDMEATKCTRAARSMVPSAVLVRTPVPALMMVSSLDMEAEIA